MIAGHGIVGVLGVWYLVRHLRIGPWSCAVCCITYTLSTPSVSYTFWNFWPNHLAAWTVAPWASWVALLLLDATTVTDRLTFASLLGLLFGLMLLNGQLPHVVALGIGMAILVIASGRAFLDRWQWFALAATLAIVIAAFSLYSVYVEYLRFPASDVRAQFDSPIDYGKFFLYPFGDSSSFERERSRTFGGVFAALSLYAILSPAVRSPFKAGLAAASVLSWALAYVPLHVTPFWSNNLDFHDAATLYGIALGGLALTQIARGSRPRAVVASTLAIGQVALMGVGARRVWNSHVDWMIERRERATFYAGLREAFVEREIHGAIKAHLRQNSPNRILVAPGPQADLFGSYEYHRSSFFFQDLRLVNTILRGVDAHQVQPNQALMFGQIDSRPGLVKSDATLDFLGVEFVIASPSDVVAGSLKRVEAFKIRDLPPVLLYQNADALPEVVLADPSVASLDPPGLDECEHEGLLCRDFRSTLELVDNIPGLHAVRQSDRVEATFPATTQPRVALLRDMYRPQWRATGRAGDGVPRELRTFEVLGGVIGVDVPVGTSSLTIWFDPAGRGVALRVTLVAVLMSLGLIGAATARDRWRQRQSSVGNRQVTPLSHV